MAVATAPLELAKGSAQPPELSLSIKVLSQKSAAVLRATWKISHDALIGFVRTGILYRQVVRVSDSIVIHRERSSVCQVDSKDPENVSAHNLQICSIERPNTAIPVRTSGATDAHFHGTIGLGLTVNSAAHFIKRLVESILRQLL